jgi:SLT domain-containing protein
MSVDILLAQREQTYGAYKNHSSIAQRLKNTMRAESKYGTLTFYQKESLEMIQHKIARILNGDPNYADNWVDIAGYAQLVVNELSKEPNQQEPYICDRNR